MKKVGIVICLIGIICFPLNILAQQSCTIKGQVVDKKMKPLSYANVFLKNSFEGTTTDEQGNFSFKSARTGKANLICTYIGYQQYERQIELIPGATIQIQAKLAPTEIEGEAILVTASAFTAADEEGVTLTSLDVVRIPGAAADLFWAIKSFPGLQQVEEGAGLFVRGGDVSETVTILDGAVINHPYKHESPTGGYFGTFNPFLLKGTFFSSGGFSAQYGNALSGALAMESLDLPDRRYIGLGIGLAAESAYIAIPIINDKLGFSFSGNKSNTKMMFELNDNRKEFSHYPTSSDMNLNARYNINDHSYLKCFVFQEHDKVGVEVDDPDYSTHFFGNSSNELYNLRYSNLLQNKILLQANVAYSIFDRDMRLGVMDLNLKDQLYQAQITAEWDLTKSVIMRTGAAAFRSRTFITGTVPQEELDASPDALTDPVATDYTSNRYVQFLEIQFPAPLGFWITPGLRGEYESISEEYILDPRISLVYPLTAFSNFSASWGLFHQYPESRYYDPYIGNPDLTSMAAAHYILGYAYQRENRIFRIEGYYKDYKHLLLEDEQFNYINEGYGYAAGLDVFIKQSVGFISGWTAYSYLKARRKWLDSPNLASPYFDITHNLTVVFNFDLPHQFDLGTSFRYATGKPYTSTSNSYHDARVPSYQKWDITLSYLCSFFENNKTIFYIGIYNLLGRINIFDYRYSPDYLRRDAVDSSFGRSIYFGVSFNM